MLLGYSFIFLSVSTVIRFSIFFLNVPIIKYLDYTYLSIGILIILILNLHSALISFKIIDEYFKNTLLLK